ncbi:MAG: Y-family DNA polymerase [Sphingobacteriales bacterium]|nr:MAG: Y-family DNA polymerase [Sphingobacteriales bacterium]
MYALVDCNNFYASCERLFQPHLEGKPVVVLSNNDGCTIARSDEAKQLGIEMGTPAFMIEDVFKQYHVAVFSSNYTLYGDLSDRVMKTLAEFVPKIEVYSIDEAFLDMSDLVYTDLTRLGLTIRETVKRNIGIPVSVGIAPTKTLAKMANRYAKKRFKKIGVFYAANQQLREEMLSSTAVEDIWGIGRQYASLLKRNGFHTAKDVTTIPEEWMRKNMTVVGQRLWNELQGIPSIEWEYEPPAKKNICTSRSFGKLTGDKAIIIEAASNYAATCAAKLRAQNSCAKAVTVFLNTNQHKIEQPQYTASISLEFETPTNLTGEIIQYVLKGLDIIYKEGYLFKKVGVIMLGLIPEQQIQASLFDVKDRKKGRQLHAIVDKLNKSMGKDIVRMAVQGYERRYKLRADYLSKRYTTNINEILKVKI